jgi:hypothetical protein
MWLRIFALAMLGWLVIAPAAVAAAPGATAGQQIKSQREHAANAINNVLYMGKSGTIAACAALVRSKAVNAMVCIARDDATILLRETQPRHRWYDTLPHAALFYVVTWIFGIGVRRRNWQVRYTRNVRP